VIIINKGDTVPVAGNFGASASATVVAGALNTELPVDPTGIELKAELYAGGVWGDIAAAIDGNPSSAHIHGLQFNASISQMVRLSVQDTGGAQSIATNRARLSIRRVA
jgi:hypothetical protein